MEYLEGRSKATRQAQRRQLGPLRQLTVQSKTRARYDKAIEKYRNYLREENRSFPEGRRMARLPPIPGTSSISGRPVRAEHWACDSVAAVQDFYPFLRGHLPGAWRLLKTWSTNELPNRAPPLPIDALHTMVGQSLFEDTPLFALSLLLGFHGLPKNRGVVGDPEEPRLAGRPSKPCRHLTRTDKKWQASRSSRKCDH